MNKAALDYMRDILMLVDEDADCYDEDEIISAYNVLYGDSPDVKPVLISPSALVEHD